MSVKVRPHRRGGWDVDIRVLLATGVRHRERRKLNAKYSHKTAREWGERRERELLRDGPPVRETTPAPNPPLPSPEKEVPTLREFAPRFKPLRARIDRNRAGRFETDDPQHASDPTLGSKLNAIGNEDVQEQRRLNTRQRRR